MRDTGPTCMLLPMPSLYVKSGVHLSEGREVSDGEYMRLGMVLTPLQLTTVVRKSPGIEQQ